MSSVIWHDWRTIIWIFVHSMDNASIGFRDKGQICITHSMKCQLTILIMIHIINCQQSEFERYFTDWIINPGTQHWLQNAYFLIRWTEPQSAYFIFLKIERRDLRWWRSWTPRPNWIREIITALCNFKANSFTYLYIYTPGMSVVKLANTLKLSSDIGNLCLDIHQG